MHKCPYKFPHKSRKAMLAFLQEHEGYHPMNSCNGGFVLSWNIKVYRADETGKSGCYASDLHPHLDDKWAAYIGDGNELFWTACGDSLRYFTDKEWSNYPGIEQGEWGFSVNGRMGGHLILTEAPAQRWHCAMWGDYSEYLESLDTETLRRFYRAIVVLDHDLRDPDQHVNDAISFLRMVWEEDQEAEATQEAREQEAARPDLYS